MICKKLIQLFSDGAESTANQFISLMDKAICNAKDEICKSCCFLLRHRLLSLSINCRRANDDVAAVVLIVVTAVVWCCCGSCRKVRRRLSCSWPKKDFACGAGALLFLFSLKQKKRFLL